jgi:RNA polymerase sigma-70 factor (ECF subfamily)
MSEAQALIAAYLRKRADLVRFFAKRTGSAALAEDLVQEIYLKITAGPPPSEVRSPEAYLYRVGSNLMLDRARQARRQAARDGAWRLSQGIEGTGDAADELSADRVLAGRQRLQALVAALEDLPPQVARAFRRHKFDGLTHGEVAAELGVSRSSVEKYIMTALKHLLERDGQ